MERPILTRAAIAAVVLAAAACSQVTSDFVCQVDADCTQADGATGVCEADQRCAYTDAACTSGFRYGDLAGDESNDCTDTGTSPGPGPGGQTCNVAEVSAGVDDTCVRRSDGSVWCFGGGSAGSTHVALTAGTIAQIANAGGGLCARYADGSVDCSEGPMTGTIGITAHDLAIGASHVCAVTDGHMQCWGTNASGELGDGSTTASATPQGVVAVNDAIAVAAGAAATCEVESSPNEVWCWGDNSRNQLAQTIFPIANAMSPVMVSVPSGASAIAMGDKFACALGTTGNVACWGDETKAQTGQGQIGDSTATAVVVPVLPAIAQITAGGDHACARASDGRVWCWGDNAANESAAGSAAVVATPTLVVDHGNKPLLFLDVDAGAQHTCGRLAPAGELVCWGSNTAGQIGDGTTTTAVYPTPAKLGCN